MSRFKIVGQSKGIKEIAGDYDNLTRSEQLMVQQTLLGDKALKKFSKNGKLLKGINNKFKDIRNTMLGMVGANSAGQVMTSIFEKWKENLQQVVDLQNKASQGQKSLTDSVKGLVGNDKELSKDPNKLKKFINFAADEGQRLGEGGQVQVIDALKDLRSATDGTDNDKLKALKEAVSLKEFDPNTDLSAAAKSIFNVTKSLEKLNDPKLQGKDLSKVAVGFIKTLGSQFTGDASEALKQVTKLLAKKDLGVDSAQASALFAFISKATDDTEGKTSATTTGDLLSKVLTADGKKVNGKELTFESEGGFDRILEIANRLKSGEFGESSADKAKAIKSIFGEGQNTVTAVLALAQQGASKGLQNNVSSFKDSFDGVDIVARDKKVVRSVIKGSDLQDTSKGIAGKKDIILNTNTSEAAFSERAQQLQDLQESLGVTDGFDFFKDFRELVGRNGQDSEKFFKDGIKRLLERAGVKTTESSVEILGQGAGARFHNITRDNALGQTINNSSDLSEIARVAVQTGAVDLSDGLSQVEKAILVFNGLSQEIIKKLEEDKADRKALVSAVSQSPTPTKGEL